MWMRGFMLVHGVRNFVLRSFALPLLCWNLLAPWLLGAIQIPGCIWPVWFSINWSVGMGWSMLEPWPDLVLKKSHGYSTLRASFTKTYINILFVLSISKNRGCPNSLIGIGMIMVIHWTIWRQSAILRKGKELMIRGVSVACKPSYTIIYQVFKHQTSGNTLDTPGTDESWLVICNILGFDPWRSQSILRILRSAAGMPRRCRVSCMSLGCFGCLGSSTWHFLKFFDDWVNSKLCDRWLDG